MKIMLAMLCLVVAGCDQLKPSARFQLVGDSSGRAWKIDTTSGEVWICYAASINPTEKKASAECYPAEQLQR